MRQNEWNAIFHPYDAILCKYIKFIKYIYTIHTITSSKVIDIFIYMFALFRITQIIL